MNKVIPRNKDVTINPGSKDRPDSAYVTIQYTIEVSGTETTSGLDVTVNFPHDPTCSIPEFEKKAYSHGSVILKVLSDYLQESSD